MNNPNNLDHDQRGITPKWNFGKGINCEMSSSRRTMKQQRHRANAAKRMEQSRNQTTKKK